MMAILIKGLDKPKCCNECPFLRHEWHLGNYYCYVDYWDRREIYDGYMIRDDCPIEEVEDE